MEKAAEKPRIGSVFSVRKPTVSLSFFECYRDVFSFSCNRFYTLAVSGISGFRDGDGVLLLVQIRKIEIAVTACESAFAGRAKIDACSLDRIVGVKIYNLTGDAYEIAGADSRFARNEKHQDSKAKNKFFHCL